MDKNELSFEYYRFKKTVITLLCCSVVLFLVSLLPNDSKVLHGILIAFTVICVLLIPVMLFVRRLYLGLMQVTEVDFKKVYMLDKRKENSPKNINHNRMLEANMLFYSGYFAEAAERYQNILQTEKREKTVLAERRMLILALFLAEKNENVKELIQVQRQHREEIKDFAIEEEPYYAFIESFLSGDYRQAAESINIKLNSKNIQTFNNRKILVNYLMSLAYFKSGDEEKAAECRRAVLEADKNRMTAFYSYCSR